MKDAFVQGFVGGFEKTATEEADGIFSKILSKIAQGEEEPKGEEEEEEKKKKKKEGEEEETKEASAAADFDRIISKLGLGLSEEKTAAAKEEEGGELPSWMAKIAQAMDEGEEEGEEEGEKKKKKKEKEEEGEEEEETKEGSADLPDWIHKIAKKKEKWIKGAIEDKGGLHTSLGIKQGKNIPESKKRAAAKKPGKVGKQARLALTLEKLRKK